MPRILIADDEAPIRVLLRQMLERRGYVVDEAANGRQVIEMLDKADYDLLITDIIMPDQEGIETIVQMRKTHRDVKVIAISGGGKVGPDNYLNFAEKLGAHRTFSKPFRMEEITGAVADLVGPGEGKA